MEKYKKSTLKRKLIFLSISVIFVLVKLFFINTSLNAIQISEGGVNMKKLFLLSSGGHSPTCGNDAKLNAAN